MLQRRQPHHQAALIKVLQLAKWKKKIKILKQKKPQQLVGDIQILLNYGRNTRGTRIYFFLPLAVMVLAICPPASQKDTSQTSQTLKPCSPHVWFWWQFHEGFRVTNFRFSNHDQRTRNAFALLLSHCLTKWHLGQKIPWVFLTRVRSRALPQLIA